MAPSPRQAKLLKQTRFTAGEQGDERRRHNGATSALHPRADWKVQARLGSVMIVFITQMTPASSPVCVGWSLALLEYAP